MGSTAKEAPRQYKARHLRLKLEAAKVAIMEAQEEAQLFRGDVATIMMLTEAAHQRLDRAWLITFAAERLDTPRAQE